MGWTFLSPVFPILFVHIHYSRNDHKRRSRETVTGTGTDFFTDYIDFITILNIQAAVYVLAGLLVLALLPHEKESPATQVEPALSEKGAVQSEG